MRILAIDPGNIESGYVFVVYGGQQGLVIARDTDMFEPFAKVPNKQMLNIIKACKWDIDCIVIEKIVSYGMSVGAEVFDTCTWIGRFLQAAFDTKIKCSYVTRLEEKNLICHSPKANDATIKQALVDKYTWNVSNHGKGTKSNPGFFYGFKADIWSAFAVADAWSTKFSERNYEWIKEDQ